MSDREKGMEIDKENMSAEAGAPEIVDTDDANSGDSEFMKDMFEQDGIDVPESLSKESIASMLAEADLHRAGHEADVDNEAAAAGAEGGSSDKEEAAAEAENSSSDKREAAAGAEGNTNDKEEISAGVKKTPAKKTVKKHAWRKTFGWAAAIAACLMLVVLPALNAGKADVEELTEFKSYTEIYRTIDQITERERSVYEKNYFYLEGDMATAERSEESAIEDGSLGTAVPKASLGSAGSSGGAGSDQHSETYLQVEGVDEADRVKVDGKYLYFIDSTGNRIMIYRADNGKAEKVSSIRSDNDVYFRDIFLKGDRLVAVGDLYDDYTDTKTAAEIYDITDRKNPVKTADYAQSGSAVSQRMVGDILYLVTDQYVYGREVPYCGDAEKMEKLEAKDISCVPSPARAEYTVIGAVDTSSGKEISHVTKALLGGSQDIYSNGENLYVAGMTYIRKKGEKQDGGLVRRYLVPFYSGNAATMIVKVKMSNGNIKITDSAVVKGTIDDQFSMDERDGKFRIATTSTTDSGEQVNNLFVLDRKLDELGHVSGFARGESIKAVRYVKNKAYVITYEQTDPLFVIDLTDSKDPKIEGAVKIDGFSTLLVPLSENRLLGIGYGTRQVESWQEISGIKFALFDISDPSKPDVVTSKTMEGIFSDAQEDHRALVMLGSGEDAEFILPCWKEIENYAVDYDDDIVEDAEESGETDAEGKYYEYTDNSPRGGILTMSAADDRIEVKSFDEIQDGVERCPVIGDYIYAVTDMDDVVSVKLTK